MRCNQRVNRKSGVVSGHGHGDERQQEHQHTTHDRQHHRDAVHDVFHGVRGMAMRVVGLRGGVGGMGLGQGGLLGGSVWVCGDSTVPGHG